MSIPPGFSGVDKNKVCRLKKALYGLKQSPCAMSERFANVMIASSYKQSQGDQRHSLSSIRPQGESSILIVYVDDIIVTGNGEVEKDALKLCLAKEFEIKDLGKLKYFLGIEVGRSRQGIFISQRKYVTDLLKKTGMTTRKPAGTPIEHNHRLSEALEDKAVDKEMYQRLVEKLIYLSHTRLGIAYSVSVMSQFMHDPREVHAVYRVLHYLNAHPGKEILFKKGPEIDLAIYTDADYAGSLIGDQHQVTVPFWAET